jgi:hypothetical protein
MLLHAIVLASITATSSAATQKPVSRIPSSFFSGTICAYPDKPTHAATTLRAATIVPEVEPNDTVATATLTGLSMANPDVDVTGSNFGNENDYFSFLLKQGDILGVACLGTFLSGGLDPQIKLLDDIGTIIVFNDDGAAFYPPSSPMPGIFHFTDSAITFVAPANGLYHMLVQPFPQGGSPSSGTYTLQLRLRRNVFETAPAGTKQIIFADFDGATIPAQALFGGGTTPASATLSPLSGFLSDWGLSAGDETTVIDAILAKMTADFNFVSSANPGFAYELRNSRDHTDPFGVEPHVTRVVIGGTIAELGISTIGIAESIDPGNFATSETSVLLLSDLSDPSPASGTSLNNVPLGGGATIIDLIGTAVGNMASHEVGHTLGNWHTDPDNALHCLMDSGGASTLLGFQQNFFQVGADGVFGNADDNASDFVTDSYSAAEGVGAIPSVESTTARTAYAMSGPAVLPCTQDLNSDSVVDGADLGLLLGNWGNPGTGDLNSDGTVNGADLGLLLGAWGPCPV